MLPPAHDPNQCLLGDLPPLLNSVCLLVAVLSIHWDTNGTSLCKGISKYIHQNSPSPNRTLCGRDGWAQHILQEWEEQQLKESTMKSSYLKT